MTTLPKKDDFNLKSKDEEKQMVDFTNALQDNMKKVVPNLKKLIDSLEAYSNSEIALNQQTAKVITALDGIAETGMGDFDSGIKIVRDILTDLYSGRSQLNTQGTSMLIEGLKREHAQRQKEVQTLNSDILRERKKWDSDLSNAEKRTASATDVKVAIEEFKKIEKERQQALMVHLQLTVFSNRGTFGSIIGLFGEFFKATGKSLTNSGERFTYNQPHLEKLSKSKSNIPRELRNLMESKKQSYVNLSGLSSELKQILKNAGLRPSNLADKKVVTTLYILIKDRVDMGQLPYDLLDQLKSTGNVDDQQVRQHIQEQKKVASAPKGWVNARVPGKKKVTKSTPPSTSSQNCGHQTQQIQKPNNCNQTAQVPPPVPPPHQAKSGFGAVRTGAPPKATFGQSTKPHQQPPLPQNQVQDLPLPPPNDLAPPPDLLPPPPGLAPPPANMPLPKMPPPPPTSAPGIAAAPAKSQPSLLEQISQGTKLKKVTERVDPPKEQMTDQMKGDLTSLLSNVMAARRKDIADDEESDDESEDWDD
ncbi:hypothetical protein EIN_306550 [Entamoeba invadens IP1]|uniref:WH2 domain-containing protein n=1 Tax=Entamoeba invadens IP1 TaxID=370355 RepID=A0A0A1TYY2_ENTIV|nr:hypothetical protein EIN_306550 [Entamoeba invadens IP1]ELP86719.1 hypothetical protein EIN_306550 [Entamoeba invadens IP1]|eukprot:XP_004186065.1 hypothetical protein EIN_306550 [Entamoeba invadens IP1]